jgi:hypothetical protein
MADVGWQVGVFCLSWLFWLVAMYAFVYFFQRKVGKTLTRREHILLAGKVSLF